ncbi:MAG: hypothetical protein J6D23_01305 [Clostridia bacterium]|nr:hypothetical protein [Clostridia bacterium]
MAMNFNLDLQEITLDGFQVVSSKFFGKQNGPVMSMQRKCIVFNSAAVKQLNNCEAIQIMINEAQKVVLIKPVPSHDSEAVLWNKGEKKQYARLECVGLVKHLMEKWKFDSDIKYLVNGRLVRVENKVMMVFDFKDCQRFDSTGKRL